MSSENFEYSGPGSYEDFLAWASEIGRSPASCTVVGQDLHVVGVSGNILIIEPGDHVGKSSGDDNLLIVTME